MSTDRSPRPVQPSHLQMAGLDHFHQACEGETMGIIVIKDLQENVELDRQAMLAISGGSRWRAGGGALRRGPARAVRIFDLARRAPARPVAKQ